MTPENLVVGEEGLGNLALPSRAIGHRIFGCGSCSSVVVWLQVS